MHESLTRVAESTRGTSFENQIWLVGGAVRDSLLGVEANQDFDLVTEFDALELAKLLWDSGASTIPPVTYPRFGTALVRVEGADIEIVTARRESYDAQSRKPVVESATLLEDARRRDFTVNTLRKNLHSGEFVDPLGLGVTDLEQRVLRTPLDPIETFHDDPLRMMRAVRFRWKLGFEFSNGLSEAIRQSTSRLEIVSEERISDEFVKTLTLPRGADGLDDLMRLGLIDQFMPELRTMVGVEQGKYHHLDVWDHSLLVVRNAASRDVVLALACLLHDIGKPSCRTVDANGDTRFFNHENVGESIARKVLQRMKFSNSVIDEVALLIKNHMRLGSWEKWSDSAARRLIRDLGDSLDRLLDLISADVAALKPGTVTIDVETIRSRLSTIRATTPVSTLGSPLTGAEIMEAIGVEPGELVGRAKAFLEEQVIEGTLSPGDKAAAMHAIQAWNKRRDLA